MGAGGHWRWLRGVIAALFVFALAAGPAMDTLVCGDEAIAASADLHVHEGADADAGPCVDPGHPCQHGHCHYGGVVCASTTEGLAAVFVARQDHRLTLAAGPPSDRHFELMRPPRA